VLANRKSLSWLLHGLCRNTVQQKDQPFGYGGMCENRVTQYRIWQSADHCRLNRRHHLAPFNSKHGESQDPAALRVNNDLCDGEALDQL
jgi:hypothetical protein